MIEKGEEASSRMARRPRLASRMRTGFRLWRRSRPFWAGLWAILGGFIIAYVPATGYKFLFTGVALWVGILVGVLVGTFGMFLWLQPQFRYMTSVLIILLSMVSFMTSDFGGFFVGMLLGILGGSMGLAWLPTPARVRRRGLLRTAAAEEEAHTVIELEPEPAPAALEPEPEIAASVGAPAVVEPAEVSETIELPELIELPDDVPTMLGWESVPLMIDIAEAAAPAAEEPQGETVTADEETREAIEASESLGAGEAAGEFIDLADGGPLSEEEAREERVVDVREAEHARKRVIDLDIEAQEEAAAQKDTASQEDTASHHT